MTVTKACWIPTAQRACSRCQLYRHEHVSARAACCAQIPWCPLSRTRASTSRPSRVSIHFHPCQRRSGAPSATTAPAQLTRSSSSSRAASPRASWSASAGSIPDFFRRQRKSRSPEAAPMSRRCASTSPPYCTESERGWMHSRSCSSGFVTWTRRTSLRRPAAARD